MDAKQFIEALDLLENEKHIRREYVIEALKEALKKAYIKNIGAADEANVVVVISDNPPTLEIKHIREVVADDDEEDKSLQITLTDANKGRKAGLYEVGDEFITEVDPDSLSRLAALAVRSILRQKLADIEKEALYEKHKESVGTLVSGSVEKCDERGMVVSIDQTSFNISRKELIGDEIIKQGMPVQFYLSEVSSTEKGPSLKLSRSDVGFLKCVIEDEIPEIHNGIVVIKNIVREAGVRSKVAVYSTSNLVDPITACIGKGSSLLRAVCNRVGTSSMKEKVNFVQYSDDIALYAAEALRPANVLKIGVESNEFTDKNGNVRVFEKVIAIIGNDDKDLASALGARGANLRLASKLVGKTIEVLAEKELADSDYADLDFVDVEALRAEQKSQAQTKIISQRAEEIVNRTTPIIPAQGANVKYKPQQILDEDIVDEEPVVVTLEETPVVEEVKPATSPVVETPVAAKEEVVDQPRVVKTTTTLESLEKSLETSKKKEAFKGNTKKRPHKITDDEVEEEKKVEPVVAKGPQMDIYSQEEIEAFEAEEYDDNNVDDDDIDYEDFEEYYEEN
ncbi:MAG: transcription termination factor NusA [Bacilli bacterium]|nr:transcription termination factor NusA [Bacilli bacterium]